MQISAMTIEQLQMFSSSPIHLHELLNFYSVHFERQKKHLLHTIRSIFDIGEAMGWVCKENQPTPKSTQCNTFWPIKIGAPGISAFA